MKLTLHTLDNQKFRRFTALVHGEPKSGKTSLVRTFEPHIGKKPDGSTDWSRVLFIFADPGQASILDLKEIRAIRCPQDYTPFEVLEGLQEKGATDGLDLIVIDGYDSVCQLIFDELETKEIARAAKVKQNPDTRGVWGDFGKEARKWTLGMRDLPGPSVVFLDHTQEKEDGDIKYRPSFPGGKVRDELVGYFDYVLYQMVVNPKDPKLKEDLRAELASRPYPAIWITSRSTMDGGDPRYETGTRVRADVPKLQGKMPADLSLLYKTLFGDKEGK